MQFFLAHLFILQFSTLALAELIPEKTPYPEEKIVTLENFGVTSMEGIFPFSVSLTADGGSHRWIFIFGPDGRAKSALLLVEPKLLRPPQKGPTKAYSETYQDGFRIRKLLTTREAVAQLESIRMVIYAQGHRERYEYFYDGGAQESQSGLNSDPDDPFQTRDTEEVNLDERTLEERASEEFNENNLSAIAQWTKHFRQDHQLPAYRFPAGTVGKAINLNEVTEVGVFGGHYEPRKRPPRRLNTRFEMGEVVRQIGFQKTDGKLPQVLTPHFATLVLHGKDQKVVSIISVQTADNYCVARVGTKDKEGRYLIDHDNIQAEFYSPELCKLLYESIAKNDPDYLKEMKNFFKGSSMTLEETILGKSKKKE